MKLHLRFLRMP